MVVAVWDCSTGAPRADEFPAPVPLCLYLAGRLCRARRGGQARLLAAAGRDGAGRLLRPLPGAHSLLPTPYYTHCTYHMHHVHHAHHAHHIHYTYYQGHWLSATAFLVNATGNATVAAAAERVVEVYASVMEAWHARYGDATTAPCHTNTLITSHTPCHLPHTPDHATPVCYRYGDAEDGYLFPYDPLVWDKLVAGHGAAPYYSVPFYTLVNPNLLLTL